MTEVADLTSWKGRDTCSHFQKPGDWTSCPRWHSGVVLTRKYFELLVIKWIVASDRDRFCSTDKGGVCPLDQLPQKCIYRLCLQVGKILTMLCQHYPRVCSVECLVHTLAELSINATFWKHFFSLMQLSEHSPSCLWDDVLCCHL